MPCRERHAGGRDLVEVIDFSKVTNLDDLCAAAPASHKQGVSASAPLYKYFAVKSSYLRRALAGAY